MDYLYKTIFGCIIFLLVYLPVDAATAITPTETMHVQSLDSNGNIYTVVSLDNTAYIGGSFTQLFDSRKNPVNRNNIAGYDFNSDSFNSWNPLINGSVRAIAVNHTTIYIGGEFTEINGQERRYLASFDRATGNLTNWSPRVNGVVYALALDGPDLYIGGNFDLIDGQTRENITIYDSQRNEVVGWMPDINGPVYAIAIDNLTVYLGGEFTEVNGVPHTYAVAFDKATGNITDWSPKLSQPVRGMSLIASTIYLRNTTDFTSQPIVTYNVTTNSYNYTQQSSGNITVTPTSVVPQGGSAPTPVISNGDIQGVMVNQGAIGFKVPNLSDILTFVIRAFFVITGLVALFYLLLGAFAWVTSGGDKDAIGAARDKIQAAIIGVIMIVAVLAIVVTLEQVVFRKRLCFGISCPASIPSLVQPI